MWRIFRAYMDQKNPSYNIIAANLRHGNQIDKKFLKNQKKFEEMS